MNITEVVQRAVVVGALVVGGHPLIAAPIDGRASRSESAIEVSPAREVSPRHIGATDGSQGLQAVASDGELTYVVWVLNRTAFVSTFDREGAFVSEHRIGDGFRTVPSITWDGRRLVLAWTAGFDISAAVLDSELSVVTSHPRLAREVTWPSLATDGEDFVITWSDIYPFPVNR